MSNVNIKVRFLPPRSKYSNARQAIEATAQRLKADSGSLNSLKGSLLSAARLHDDFVELEFSWAKVLNIATSEGGYAECRASVEASKSAMKSDLIIDGRLEDEENVIWGDRGEAFVWKRAEVISSLFGREVLNIAPHELGLSLDFSNGFTLMFATITLVDSGGKALFWSEE